MLIVNSLLLDGIDLGNVKNIRFLSTGDKVKFEQKDDGLYIKMPSSASKEDVAFTFKVSFAGNIPNLKK